MRSKPAWSSGAITGGLFLLAIEFVGFAVAAAPTQAPLFVIGTPDAHAAEFGLARPGEGYMAFLTRFAGDVVYTVGQSKPHEWPYIHPAVRDTWAGGRAHTFTIRFSSKHDEDRPLFFVVGMSGGTPVQCSKVAVTVGQAELPAQVAPGGDPRVCFQPTVRGKPESLVFEVPAGLIRQGQNSISIRLDDESWILYDYVALHRERRPLEIIEPPEPDLLAEFRKGPMAGVDEIVFAARALGEDPHWYANFGYTLDHSNWKTYGHGGRLVRLNLTTGETTLLVDDPRGGVRDPVVHYDGQKILFSYRQGDGPHYHLFEIHADGSGLRQLTEGPFDDVEPIYLPDGRIMFVSSRCNRCVNCHTTDVAVLHSCDADGGNVRMLSANNEHDNTPWLLPSGQVLYTRWEYVDRNQVRFHHLWTSSTDGLRQAVFFGNMHPGTYAALGTGMIGGFEIVDRSIRLDRSDTEWPSMKASIEALTRRCVGCHAAAGAMPLATSPSHLAGPGAWGTAFTGQGPWIDLAADDVRRRWTRHLLYNLSRPEKSLILLAPLSKQAGGYESCGEAVFAGTDDADFQKVLRAIRDAKERLDAIKRFDMREFRPREEYVREMKRYGILSADLDDGAAIDVYATDRAYWQSHWHRGAEPR